jgi:hypothetical protein
LSSEIPSKEKSKTKLETISFKSFIEEYKIDSIDFLKMDIEGEEFSFFLNSWNFDFVINNVKKIASEFHLNYLREVKGNNSQTVHRKIKQIIETFENNNFKVWVKSLDGMDIKNQLLHNQYLMDSKKEAIDYYHQIMFYANKNV